MKNLINKQTILAYLLPTLLNAILLGCIPFLLIVVGLFLFIIGALQVLIMIVITIRSLIIHKKLSIKAKRYWLIVFIYILFGCVLGLICDEIRIHGQAVAVVWCSYSGLSILPAIYFFKNLKQFSI